MENMKKAAMAILLILACVFVLVSCDTKDDVTYYQESVTGKYGDGIRLIGVVEPETAPTSYTDMPRVEKEIYFDTRLEGWHFAGVYVVAGEKITLTLPAEKADGSLTAAVGRYTQSQFSVALDSEKVSFVSPVSGLLDVDLGECYGDDFWQMTVSGGIAASYYRLGLDRVAEWKNSVGYAVVDTANVRIYLPAEYIDNAEDVEKAVTWWRSFCEYADGYTAGDFGKDKLSPTDVFVGTSATLRYDGEKDALYVPSSYADVMLDADSLSGGAAWDVMLELCKGKTVNAGFSAGGAADVAAVLAAGAFATLTDGVLSADRCEEYWINNAYACLSESLTGGLAQYGDLAVYVNLMHSFGVKTVVDTAIEYVSPSEEETTEGQTDGEESAGTDTAATDKDKANAQTLAGYFCVKFAEKGIDLAPYMNGIFGLDVISAGEDLTVYVPLQSKYALGATASDDKTGITVNSGETAVFDLQGSAVSSAKEVRLVKATVGGEEWKADADGLYRYRPSDSTRKEDFTLEYEADGSTVVLHGRFTCNIAVSVFSRYENVPWRDMKSAVKEYADNEKYLTDTRAVSKAEVPQNDEIDDSVYTFSVNNGVIQVEETATYIVYVRNKGMTRVDFGVPEYMFTMFENTLTVSDYTDLLCYEIELQQGVSYYYDIYILGTKGNAYACLGIEKKGEGQITDIDENYLVYYPFDRADMTGYVAPALVPYTFGVSLEGKDDYDDLGATATSYPTAAEGSSIAYACDGKEDTVFVSEEAEKHVYDFELANSVRTDYVTAVTGNEGVSYSVYYSLDGSEYTLAGNGVTTGVIDVKFEKTTRLRFIRLVLEDEEAFASRIADVSCGLYKQEATIVPSNSSRVLYQGKWQYKTGGISVNGWILESYGDDAAIEFNFYGSAIAVYCAKGDVYGSMQIYVDGKQYGSVELNSPTTLYDCNVFGVEFDEPGNHRIRIVPSSDDDIINLDYFTVVYAEQKEAAPEVGNLWYFAIIPTALIAIFVVCLALDIADRRGKKRRMAQKAGMAGSSEDEKEDGREGEDRQ